jgi:heterokaryon incompatibility protein (HET)
MKSEEHFDTMRNWIESCSSHTKCTQTVSGSVEIDARNSILPTCCIQVSKGMKGFKLRETRHERGTYITLTHRWNSDTETFKTISSNYDARLNVKEFNIVRIPPLFHDVFTIAEKLGIQYVWIDSICIIQDGDGGADWRREAPKLAQYYQFSLFAIAGTMENIQYGLFRASVGDGDFSPWYSQLMRLPYRDKDGLARGYFYVYCRKVHLVEDYWNLIRKSIIFQRGWILQEWLLSKRIVWYTSKGIFFECHFQPPRSDGQEVVDSQDSPALRAHIELKTSFHLSTDNILGFWYRAIEVYSKCHLTKPELDRILAISGLAKEVGRIMASSGQQQGLAIEVKKEVFLAGLWLRALHHGLLWEEDPSTKPWQQRIAAAPSWSWASLVTPVKFPKRDEKSQEALSSPDSVVMNQTAIRSQSIKLLGR